MLNYSVYLGHVFCLPDAFEGYDQICDVPSNGDCMFSSIAVQLGDPTLTARDVRSDVVTYMRSHMELVR
jgi:hypothetical protein